MRLITILVTLFILFSCREDQPISSRPTGDMKDDPIDPSLTPASKILSPEEALKEFDLEPGFKIELVAAEPLIETPIVAHFDYDGHLWLLTMPSYMTDTLGSNENNPSGQLLKLSDKDHDGYYETKEVKIDGLILARAFKVLDKGILLAEPPNLWWYPLADGTMSARTLIDSMYATEGDIEHKPNALYWNLDNWIYSAKSAKRFKQDSTGEWISSNTEFRGQWGISSDDFGRLYYNNNSTALQCDDGLADWLTENPYYEASSRGIIGLPRTDNLVHPSGINPGVNRAYSKGVLDSTGKLTEVTAACGALVYRNHQFPPAYDQNYFVCEPAANLVQRIKISTDEEGFIHATPADLNREFLRSRDERFRPVDLFDGPDGCIYLVDMHRGVIQHKNYLTSYLKRQIGYRDLQSRQELGRIFRICYQGDRLPIETLSDKSDEALSMMLINPAAYYRDRARELLIQRKAGTAVMNAMQTLVTVVTENNLLPFIWTLDGLGLFNLQMIHGLAEMKLAGVNLTLLKLIQNRPVDVNTIPTIDSLCSKKIDYLSALPIIKKLLVSHEQPGLAWLARLEKKYPGDTLVEDAIIKTISGHETAYLKHTLGYQKILEEMVEKKKNLPDQLLKMDPLAMQSFKRGYELFSHHCAICHGKNGTGTPGLAPSLVNSDWVMGDKDRLIRVVLDGLKGPILINGKPYGTNTSIMPGHRSVPDLTNPNIGDILTYVRGAFGHQTDQVGGGQVRNIKNSTVGRGMAYEMKDFEQKN